MQTYIAGRWYLLEVEIGAGGVAMGRLYDSDGTTLLGSVSHTFGSFGSGGVAFRGFSSIAIDTIRFCH